MSRRQLIVVGAGAAGLMAAGQAIEAGAEVLLLEKMPRPALKLRITGKGRCNVTNIAPLSDFIEHFGPGGRFLYQAFARFFSDDLIAFLEARGVPVVIERGGRVFPATDRAADIVDALLGSARRASLQTHTEVDGLLVEGDRVVGVRASGGRGGRSAQIEYLADAVLIATGGASYPGTGSTGDGYRLAQSVGHSIVPIRPALVPIETAGDTAARLQGLSLRNVTVRVWADGKRLDEAFGEMIFTHYGVSGPIILGLSRQIVDALEAGRQVSLSIDLKPALDENKLDARLLRDLDQHSRRQFHTILKGLLPSKLIAVCLDETGIPSGIPAHQITVDQRGRLRRWLKAFCLEVTGHRSFREAIVTAGGVETREVDPRTMESRLVRGLYFAGEVLDLDADTGGYNLQAAFSTGWVAGRAAAGL